VLRFPPLRQAANRYLQNDNTKYIGKAVWLSFARVRELIILFIKIKVLALLPLPRAPFSSTGYRLTETNTILLQFLILKQFLKLKKSSHPP